jgi:hypothetical protein
LGVGGSKCGTLKREAGTEREGGMRGREKPARGNLVSSIDNDFSFFCAATFSPSPDLSRREEKETFAFFTPPFALQFDAMATSLSAKTVAPACSSAAAVKVKIEREPE